MKFQPVVKWSGSKRSQSEMIISKIPRKEYDTYYEPFCGGCSVLFQLLHSDIKFKNYICSDKNEGLIKLWNEIKDNPLQVADTYEKMWHELNIDDDKERKKQYFYMVRERYNKEHNPYDFMFIMRTTTNGMPRYNNNGEFNNSFHVTRDGIKPETLRQVIFEWSKELNKNNVQFIYQEYQQINTSSNDFIYLDPPYAGTKGMYYGTIDYEQLWNWLRNQKCNYMLSFDGKTSSKDITYDVPKDLYSTHEYLNNGNSAFSRVVGNSTSEYVSESLYIKSF